jgi:hypothetical protein
LPRAPDAAADGGPALEPIDRALLEGAHGAGAAAAMAMLLSYARMVGAQRFLDVDGAHVDGCLLHGRASLDFAFHFVKLGARVRVPTTLNVTSIDALHPERNFAPDNIQADARALMGAYVAMGARPTWTCAPYQLRERPAFGRHVAWAESNAIVFANSVLGARTARYGDFVDLMIALTGRAPAAGLHLDENRRPGLLFDARPCRAILARRPIAYALLGHLIGAAAADSIPAIMGIPPDCGEDDLKRLGAAAASSGAVALFHACGVTPEAPDEATADALDLPRHLVSPSDLFAAREALGPGTPGEPIRAICLGTPHYSRTELHALAKIVRQRGGRARAPFIVSTSRFVLEGLSAHDRAALEAFGVAFLVDTCTYVSATLPDGEGLVLTDSGKWAHYAPGNIGARARLADANACVASALSGRLEPDDAL